MRGRHEATVVVQEFAVDVLDEQPFSCGGADIPDFWLRNGNWPLACECSYVFEEEDHRGLNYHRLFRAEDGSEYTLMQPPVGGMWFATWMPRNSGKSHPPLIVQLPDGFSWNIDGPSSNGDGWVRTGEPPNITATPSILTGGYHGFLQAGVLTDDVDGRTFSS